MLRDKPTINHEELTECIVHLIQSEKINIGSSCSQNGRSSFKTLIGKPTGKRPLGRPRRTWEKNIRMDLREIGINLRNWVDSTQHRDYWRAFVKAALNLRVE